MHILQRVVIAFALAAGAGSYISGVVAGIYLLVMLVLVIVARPYKDLKQNIRNIINDVCGIGIICVYTYVSYSGSSPGNTFAVYLPFVLIGLVFVPILMGVGYISLQLVITLKSCFSS